MWHLTCAFYGDVAETRRSELEERLARTAKRHPVFELRFAGAGAFPRSTRATVLFVGVHAVTAAASGDVTPPETAEPAELHALAASCAAAGRRIGHDVEGRRYRPHLTLARAKSREPVDMRSVVEELRGYEGPSWTASEIVLMRSHLGADAHYEALARWPLGGHQA